MESKLSEEDEEAYAMQRITDTLTAAGYFRARLGGLSSFDKVVGGMTWAITASGMPVDVDVEFKENPSLGEKVAISENIVRALRTLLCPVLIKPHQIQGVDLSCQPLFPVIQWLVKAVYDHRLTTGNLSRKYSSFRYSVDFADRRALAARRSGDRSKTTLKPIAKRPETSRLMDALFGDDDSEEMSRKSPKIGLNFRRKRVFTKAKDSKYATESAFVDATLLEYGHKFRVAGKSAAVSRAKGEAVAAASDAGVGGAKHGAVGGGGKLQSSKFGALMSKLGHDSDALSKGKSKKAVASKKPTDGSEQLPGSEAPEETETEEEEARRLEAMESAMAAANGDSEMTGSKLVGLIDASVVVDSDSDDEDFATLNADELRKHDKEFAYKKKMERIEAKIGKYKEEKEEVAEQYSMEVSVLEELEAELTSVSTRKAAISAKIAELNVEEAKSEHRDILGKLKALVLENEGLKKERKAFAESCSEQSLKMEERMRQLEERVESDDSEDAKRIGKIEEYYAKQCRKRDELARVLAERNQELSRVSRDLEAYPSRAELLQYEKRFVELYAQTNDCLKETKKYYELYNSLGDVHSTIQNELDLLTRIKEEFPSRVSTADDCSAFVKSLQKIVANLDALAVSGKEKLDTAESDKNTAAERFSKLMSFQRKYYQKVKEFQETCQLNAEISRRLEIAETRYEQLTADTFE